MYFWHVLSCLVQARPEPVLSKCTKPRQKKTFTWEDCFMQVYLNPRSLNVSLALGRPLLSHQFHSPLCIWNLLVWRKPLSLIGYHYLLLTERRAQVRFAYLYLNGKSHGQNLSSTSGQAEVIVQYSIWSSFYELLPHASSLGEGGWGGSREIICEWWNLRSRNQ